MDHQITHVLKAIALTSRGAFETARINVNTHRIIMFYYLENLCNL